MPHKASRSVDWPWQIAAPMRGCFIYIVPPTQKHLFLKSQLRCLFLQHSAKAVFVTASTFTLHFVVWPFMGYSHLCQSETSVKPVDGGTEGITAGLVQH